LQTPRSARRARPPAAPPHGRPRPACTPRRMRRPASHKSHANGQDQSPNTHAKTHKTEKSPQHTLPRDGRSTGRRSILPVPGRLEPRPGRRKRCLLLFLRPRRPRNRSADGPSEPFPVSQSGLGSICAHGCISRFRRNTATVQLRRRQPPRVAAGGLLLCADRHIPNAKTGCCAPVPLKDGLRAHVCHSPTPPPSGSPTLPSSPRPGRSEEPRAQRLPRHRPRKLAPAGASQETIQNHLRCPRTDSCGGPARRPHAVSAPPPRLSAKLLSPSLRIKTVRAPPPEAPAALAPPCQ